MALSNLQNKSFDVVAPVEIDKACERLRSLLSTDLSWISHPFHIAQRFYNEEGGRAFYYPETYCKSAQSDNYSYHRLTPDSAYTGMLFFMVGAGKTDFGAREANYVTYPVSIIFSVNLELINKTRLVNEGLFTQSLIKSARRVLTNGMFNFDFEYKVISETRDLKEVYREFSLNKIEQYNRAPMQCFRIDLSVTIQEECEDY